MKKRILFLCTQNAIRSQMAEGMMRSLFGDQFQVFSAGTDPDQVHPKAVAAMKALGVDISSHRSKSVDLFKGESFDYIVTVCSHARENCPHFPGGGAYLHYSLEDPTRVRGTENEILQAFVTVGKRVRAWLQETFGETNQFK